MKIEVMTSAQGLFLTKAEPGMYELLLGGHGFSPLDSHRLVPSHGVAVVPSRDLSRKFGRVAASYKQTDSGADASERV